MIVVIQCAARKQANAGHLRTADGRCVKFVANPSRAPPDKGLTYAHPDDDSDWGKSWRAVLKEYNGVSNENPLGLLQAGQLYTDETYGMLMKHNGPERLYILSAGWGLIRSDYLLPYYDITFSGGKRIAAFKRRCHRDKYHDCSMLPFDTDESITFFGGRAYVKLFCMLTNGAKGLRYVWQYSANMPDAERCVVRRFNSRNPRRWHYECAKAYVRGELDFDSS